MMIHAWSVIAYGVSMCVCVVVLLGGHMSAWSSVADFCNLVFYHVCMCVVGLLVS